MIPLAIARQWDPPTPRASSAFYELAQGLPCFAAATMCPHGRFQVSRDIISLPQLWPFRQTISQFILVHRCNNTLFSMEFVSVIF